jgi:hypothetical protein
MINSSFNEAAAAKGQMAQGAINFIKADRAAEAAALDFPWDVTSPEGIIAFFGEKLKQTNGDLQKLIRSQENRSKDVKMLETMTAMLAKGEDLKPGSPDWPEFQRLAGLVLPSLGVSDDAKAIAATIADATKSVLIEDSFRHDNPDGLAAFMKAHPNATQHAIRENGDGPLATKVSCYDGEGLNAASAKELGDKLKALSGNKQSENQMDAIHVQELVGRISQITSLASNILHKFDEAAMGPIANIK